jgi:hypothetical protein
MIYRDRVEVALPARMMFAISHMAVFGFAPGCEEQGRKDLEKMRALLMHACLEPIEGLPRKMALVLGKQIDRLHNEVMAEYDQSRADKVATAVYYLLKDLTDTGYLELWEGSAMAEAAAIYLPMIEHVFEEGRLDESAQKQARRIMQKLQSKGYYQ